MLNFEYHRRNPSPPNAVCARRLVACVIELALLLADVQNCCCVQLWRKYLTNTKVSFVENNADCARRHKAEIEAVAKGRVYVGRSSVKPRAMLSQHPSCPVMLKVSACIRLQVCPTRSSPHFGAFDQQKAHQISPTQLHYMTGGNKHTCHAVRVTISKCVMPAGDQEDAALLNEIKEDALAFSGYDIIVDDGGHKSSQMLASFRVSCAPA